MALKSNIAGAGQPVPPAPILMRGRASGAVFLILCHKDGGLSDGVCLFDISGLFPTGHLNVNLLTEFLEPFSGTVAITNEDGA